MTDWYYQSMDDEVGPLSGSDLLDHVRAGQIKPDTLIRKDDSQWVPAREVNGLFDAAKVKKEDRLCPYCGKVVDAPPTTCRGCGRKLVLSFSAGITEQKSKKKDKPKKSRDEEVEEIVKRQDRRDIIRLTILLVLWAGLLGGGLYMINLASSGRLFADQTMTTISIVTISFVLGVSTLVIIKIARA